MYKPFETEGVSQIIQLDHWARSLYHEWLNPPCNSYSDRRKVIAIRRVIRRMLDRKDNTK